MILGLIMHTYSPFVGTDCSFGQATTDYFWLGFTLLIPFWLSGIYFGSGTSSSRSFPLLAGYQAWHNQLMVACAMTYRAFKRHHPKMLCLSLFLCNTIELGLVWTWRPSDVQLLNNVRLSGDRLYENR